MFLEGTDETMTNEYHERKVWLQLLKGKASFGKVGVVLGKIWFSIREDWEINCIRIFSCKQSCLEKGPSKTKGKENIRF